MSALALEFHVSRAARERGRYDRAMFATDGRVVLARPADAHAFAARLTEARRAAAGAAVRPARAAELFALGLLDEAAHVAIARHREQADPRAFEDALAHLAVSLGEQALERTLLAFAEAFPASAVFRRELTAAAWLADSTAGRAHRAIALEEMLLLSLENQNPAATGYRDLFDDAPLAHGTAYARLVQALEAFFATRPRIGPERLALVEFLRAPLRAAPGSLAAQLDWVRERWGWLLGDLVERMLVAFDLAREEERYLWAQAHAGEGAVGPHGVAWAGGDSSSGAVPAYEHNDVELERFSRDEAWMPRTVMIAKSTHVWLDQLARAWRRPVSRLDEIPNEELDRLASFGITALWLIGLWERSRASREIKQRSGNPDAAASAYSLHDYVIAGDLGGEDAWRHLRDRAAARGIRLASDMVPNHMGIDSPWVIEHPEWFLARPDCPYPAYRFEGPDLSGDARVEIKIEDHYWDRSDAAVVFRRVDRHSHDTRYLYHGNDGTSFPWNDTAQLDYLNPAAREQVIRTILAVARRFPIIRFDAAMTLAKRHIQRLWFPEPAAGGAIPSRAGHGLARAEFDRLMPQEFWREVVDRVGAEAPGTLLLAEAFWLMEGYFVRTLGMHRVYNSAFMNMTRDEQNANYRSVIKNTLAFDPEILQRWVNFMNNPDERTAVDQFGKGEKYFGVCVMLATLPGLPMFGHGQFEGFEERYGMEFRRALHEEAVDEGMVAEHRRRIVPLLQRRWLFAGAAQFTLYDAFTDDGRVNEDVFAYSNREGTESALVLFHNRHAETHVWIRWSAAFAEKRDDGSRPLVQRALADALALRGDDTLLRCRDLVHGREHLFRAGELREQGMRVELRAYESRAFVDWRVVAEDARPWRELERRLQGRGAADLEDALWRVAIEPAGAALGARLVPATAPWTAKARAAWTADAAAELNAHAARLLGGDASPAAVRARATALAKAVEPLRASLAAEGIGEEAARVFQVLRALDVARDPVAVFDTLRLREALAGTLGDTGTVGEERWRVPARLRAALTHAGADSADEAWAALLTDPDVRWVLDVREGEGEARFSDAAWESLAAWMALAAAAAGEPAKALAGFTRSLASWRDAARSAQGRLAGLVRPEQKTPVRARRSPASARPRSRRRP